MDRFDDLIGKRVVERTRGYQVRGNALRMNSGGSSLIGFHVNDVRQTVIRCTEVPETKRDATIWNLVQSPPRPRP